jgi:hypothetical protein
MLFKSKLFNTKFLTVFLYSLSFNLFFGQQDVQLKDSSWNSKPEIKLSGFLDVYYVYDFNSPKGYNRHDFLYNHNRHNEFNINLALMKLSLEHSKYRSNLSFQAGTYVSDNYIKEEGVFKFLNEANVGLSLNKKNNLWIDFGIFNSHIGFENAISSENLTLTRSLLAENSPYFLTGSKLTYSLKSNIELSALVLNGWQRIRRLEGNSLPSFGTQLKFEKTKKIVLNWSTFVGTDSPDSIRKMRYFNNFYAQFNSQKKINILLGFDFGLQQKEKNSTAYDLWLSPIVISQYLINKNFKTAFRIEYYQDKNGVIIQNDMNLEFGVFGFSWNFDYSPNDNLICRFETRLLKSQNDYFKVKDNFTNLNYSIVFSTAIKLNKSE